MKDPSVISYYEIINKGPSILRELSGSVFVPYSIKVGNVEVVLIDPNNETITGSYKNDSIDFTWYKDNILIFKNGSSIGVEEQEVENFTVFQNFDFPRMRRQIEPSTKIDLQSNATVFLNCSNPNVTCLEFKFTAKNFKAEHDQSIIINIGVSFDLDKIGEEKF